MNPFSIINIPVIGWLEFAFFAFIFFLLVRFVVLWYWKIDRIEELLGKIEENTRKVEKKESVENINK